MAIFKDIAQNTDEWYQLRLGKLTGSKADTVMANHPKAFTDTAKKYALQLALEQITGNGSEGYYNEHMERGHTQEPIARMLYEQTYFTKVEPGGFFDGGDTGVSPDGLVGLDGLVEIKAHVPHIHFANIKRGDVNPTYKWQYRMALKETGRQWLDFISYCSEFPESQQLYVCRIYSDQFKDEFEMMDERFEKFFKLRDQAKERILNSTYFVDTKNNN